MTNQEVYDNYRSHRLVCPNVAIRERESGLFVTDLYDETADSPTPVFFSWGDVWSGWDYATHPQYDYFLSRT